MVRVGIRVMLGLQLVSSRFGNLFYVDFYMDRYILCTCDIFASEINTLLLLLW